MTNRSPLENYYRLHATIYDSTRWSFLFGRDAIINQIRGNPRRILEVGCGTGRNLVHLCRRFPDAHITGVDLSGQMLAIARKKTAAFGNRVVVEKVSYDRAGTAGTGFDLVLFSYALSMFNPGYEEAIAAAHADLAPGGQIAVVDFDGSPAPGFRRWMAFNHVRMECHLLPRLRARFTPQLDAHRSAYNGLWYYFLFIGRKD